MGVRPVLGFGATYSQQQDLTGKERLESVRSRGVREHLPGTPTPSLTSSPIPEPLRHTSDHFPTENGVDGAKGDASPRTATTRLQVPFPQDDDRTLANQDVR